MSIALLAGDIGGTYSRLRLVTLGGQLLAEQTLANASWPALEPMLHQFLAPYPPIAAAALGVAGPVQRGRCSLTNLGWTLDQTLLAKQLAAPVVLLNDFVAVGWGLGALDSAHRHTLQAGAPDATAPRAALGAGTGLGQVWMAGTQVLSSEGSHATFAPTSDLQTRFVSYLADGLGLSRVSTERVLSGSGLGYLADFLRRPNHPLAPGDRGQAVVQAAQQGDATATWAVHQFVHIYGAVAGDLALHTLCRGGCYLAGGLVRHLLAYFEPQDRFITAFRAKGRMSSLLHQIPVYAVLDPGIGLIGATERAKALVGGGSTP